MTWCRNRMETFSALVALCVGNSPVTGQFPSRRPVKRSFDAFFDLRLNKLLRKPSRRRWFESSRSLWRHYNGQIPFPGPIFCLWLSNVSANETRRCVTSLLFVSTLLINLRQFQFQTHFHEWKVFFLFRFEFHWSLFPKGQLTIFQHWFR